MIAMEAGRRPRAWLVVTGLLGAAFVGVELYEFSNLIAEGATPQRSAFLSAFFTLVGTHGLHVTVGLIWLVVMLVQLGQRGLIAENRNAADVPLDVLALPGRRLDRRLHLRLSARSRSVERRCNPRPPGPWQFPPRLPASASCCRSC
jgi:hypothetical protein